MLCLLRFAFITVFATACAAAAPAQTLDLASSNVIDLTHAFDADTIYWPTSPSGFELKPLHRGLNERGFFYAANAFCSPEHGGTHLDAPLHFGEGKWTSADIPADRFVGPAVVIDIAAKAEANPDYLLSPADILAFEAAHGQIKEGTIVLLRTGWSARWPNKKAYLGDDTPNDASHLHFPSFGPEAAALLVNERRVRLIGVDTASVDGGTSKDFFVHRIVAAANVSGIENLTHLDQLPATGAIVIALPMKITMGSGGPARVIAIVAKEGR
ncbi:cyclase family protein [Methylocystis bryophila]|uniref:Cyclase n=1 Tax=Methylocystis bryophila TaxID=655015 RepID=A0A1W6MQR3_9HYPH|nr:cyclase family protein [Methylocystis bryophila]ARN79902.1 cyclase [Methylocystis bryophila]BDV39796.1 cyclase [Methylocystis bryophila]